MANANNTVRAAIADQAADWLVLNRGGEMPAQERAEFVVWLKSSPLHVEEYLMATAASRNLQAAAAAMEVDIDALLAEARAEGQDRVVSLWKRQRADSIGSRPHWWTQPRNVAAVAAAALLALVGAVWIARDLARPSPEAYLATAHGEQRYWALSDGTELNLNSDSAVTVRYTKSERLVRLERGQALFHVARENGRRFRVVAGETAVTAVGTRFDVYRKLATTVITVVEGKVEVSVDAGQAMPLGAGEQATVDRATRNITRSTVDAQQAVAWTLGQIAFDQRPLGEVAEEFNRYSAIPIVIESEALRALPISGVFDAHDTESFIAFVARLDGVEIQRFPDRILVRAKSG
jgi:transmembrane sensor